MRKAALIKRSIRDLYNKDIDEVLVAGEEGYREAKDFMRMLMPSHAKNVQPYRDATPIFTRFGVEPQLDADVLTAGHPALGRLHRHQPDRSAGVDRRELGQVDARAQHRGHRPPDKP
jgi:hypothetical protein